MGVFSFVLWLSLSFFLFFSSISTIAVSGGGDLGDIATSSSNSSPPLELPHPPPPPPVRQNVSAFKPSIAVVVGVLTTVFSITFLLLLYAKHCKRGNGYGPTSGAVPSTLRKNSGIDRTIIESLPVFHFHSLRGQKEGLECAVCLNRFEPVEVLRLLPKCKHAFHVECVDTWLDAHSTCPLCRYRVDPEDILLVESSRIDDHRQQAIEEKDGEKEVDCIRRVSGRHSSAGERGTGCVEIVVEKPGESREIPKTTLFNARRSLDSWNSKRKSGAENVSIGCFDKPRKDGLLVEDGPEADRASFERRFEHRILVSGGEGQLGYGGGGVHHRWSDVQPSDLWYLRSEKIIISDSRRFSVASRGASAENGRNDGRWQRREKEGESSSGRSVIKARSVSEIPGLSRFPNSSKSSMSNDHNNNSRPQRERQEGVVSRWMAWISQSRPAVRSEQSSVVS